LKRVIALAGAVGALTVGAACAPPPPPACAPGSNASAILAATNSARTSNGLPPLADVPQLDSDAQQWSNQMAATGQLVNGDLPGGYTTVGQNVLSGPASVSASTIVGAWMASPPHRANILSGSFSSIGVGVSYANCQAWVAEDFAG